MASTSHGRLPNSYLDLCRETRGGLLRGSILHLRLQDQTMQPRHDRRDKNHPRLCDKFAQVRTGKSVPRVLPSRDPRRRVHPAKGVVISSQKVVIEDEDWFEIVLPVARLKKLTDEEEGRIVEIFTQAMGKEPRVKYIGMGEPPFQQYLLIVLEESENLEQLKFVNIKTLVGKPQVQNSHSPRLKPLVTLCTEGHRLPNPCCHHRFHYWKISRGL